MCCRAIRPTQKGGSALEKSQSALSPTRNHRYTDPDIESFLNCDPAHSKDYRPLVSDQQLTYAEHAQVTKSLPISLQTWLLELS